MKLEKIIAERATKTVYRDGEKVIKLFVENYSKADILNEALNHARAEEAGLNAPKLLEVTKIDGRWAIVMEFIEGKTLGTLMEENPSKLDEHLKLFVEIQMSMHDKRSPRLNQLKDKMKVKLSQAELDETMRYDLQTKLASMPRHDKFCHGDFNPNNIIITPQGAPVIIDWSHATQGNASGDVARTYLLFYLENKPEAAEKYLDIFCAASATDKRYVQSWIPIVAASQLVKDKREQRDFLLRWTGVVDYQ